MTISLIEKPLIFRPPVELEDRIFAFEKEAWVRYRNNIIESNLDELQSQVERYFSMEAARERGFNTMEDLIGTQEISIRREVEVPHPVFRHVIVETIVLNNTYQSKLEKIEENNYRHCIGAVSRTITYKNDKYDCADILEDIYWDIFVRYQEYLRKKEASPEQALQRERDKKAISEQVEEAMQKVRRLKFFNRTPNMQEGPSVFR